MADNAFRSGPTQLTTGSVVQYTVPGATVAHILSYRVVNTTNNVAKVTMGIGVDAAGTRLHDQQDIPAHGVLDYTGFIKLAAGETFRAHSDTASALTFEMSGVEVT